jgi:undecaprenyl-diphosphatase
MKVSASGVRRAVPGVSLRGTGRLLVNWVRHQEAVVLFAALIVVLALIAFIKITEGMVHGDTREFDEWLLRALRHPGQPTVPVGPLWLMEAARDLTILGGHTILVVMLVLTLGYLALDRKYVAMWFVAVAALGGGLLSTAMKSLIGRERPAVVAHLVTVTSPSFPSGHAMLAAVVFLTLGALLARFAARRRVRAYSLSAALLLAFLVGSSRVYLGVHYPTDVLSGWAAGLAWALGCWLVARYLQYRGKIEPPGPPRINEGAPGAKRQDIDA